MTVVNVRGTARRPSFDEAESISWAGVAKTFQAYRDGYYRNTGTARPDDVPSRVQDAPSAMKNWIASKTLLGEPSADNDRDLIFFPVVNPGTNKLNEGALRAVLGGRAAQADISEAAKTSAQNMARRLLNSEFDANLETQMDQKQSGRVRTAINSILSWAHGSEENPETGDEESRLHANLTNDDLRSAIYGSLAARRGQQWGPDIIMDIDREYVYFRDGERAYRLKYTIGSDNAVALEGEPEEVQRDTRYVPVTQQQQQQHAQESQETAQPGDGSDPEPTTKGEGNMDKVKMVAALIANEKTAWKEDDKGFLEALSDEQIQRLSKEAAERPANEKPVAHTADPEPTVESQQELPLNTEPAPQVTIEAIGAMFRAELDQRDQKLTNLIESHGTLVAERAERTQLTAHLVQTHGYTEEQCASMGIEALRKTVQTVSPATFAGMGLPNFGQPSYDDNLPDPYPKEKAAVN